MNQLIESSAASLGLKGRGLELSAASLLLWLAASAIAIFLAMLLKDSAYVGGQYIPRTNDSFYHARRILDAAVGARGFYQFDERLHVPDGAWIPWPWAYDWLLAKATQVALWLNPGLDPMAFLSRVPVAWVAVNAALFLGAISALGLSMPFRIAAMLAFALSPLVQLQHAIGMLDHHYIEHTFVLLTILLGLKWFAHPDSARWAGGLGAALGVATAFHNGLFILQIPVLVCIATLWLGGREPTARSLRYFSGWLVAMSLASALPSEAFRQGMFEFALLSWFHVYIAFCTAVTIVFISAVPFTERRLAMLIGLAMMLGAPILAEMRHGALFIAGELSVLSDIGEAQSPFRLFTETYGPVETVSYYSWLLLLAPLLAVYYGYRAFRERRAAPLYYAIWVVFGLGLLLAQFRFYYYGLFALITSGLVAVDELRRRHGWHSGAVLAGALLAVLVLYQPALRDRLFIVYAPASSPEYANARPLFAVLAERCAEKPGIVLADSDDGNPLIFHTDCSVIANNFIMRADDDAKIAEIDRLMRSTPEALLEHEPPIDYLLLRAKDFSVMRDGKEVIADSSPIARALLMSDTPPAGFELLREVAYDDEDASVYARLFELRRPD